MMQVAGNHTDTVDGFLQGEEVLILDRDARYSEAFRRLLKDDGIEIIRSPPRSPNLNAFAERFMRSIKEECLNGIRDSDEKKITRNFLIKWCR